MILDFAIILTGFLGLLLCFLSFDWDIQLSLLLAFKSKYRQFYREQ